MAVSLLSQQAWTELTWSGRRDSTTMLKMVGENDSEDKDEC